MQQQLKIGDEIGFVLLANNIDGIDQTVFFPIVEITWQNNQPAYRYKYPDGNISSTAILQENLANHSIRIQSQAIPEMLPLANRQDEFLTAMERGKSSNLEVFNDWERDSFHVKNYRNNTEYHVVLKSENGEVSARCECADYIYRHRVCKHIGAVLTATVFGLSQR